MYEGCKLFVIAVTVLLTLTMTPKRHAPAKDSSSKPKRKRKMMTISKKVKLLDMLKESISFAQWHVIMMVSDDEALLEQT